MGRLLVVLAVLGKEGEGERRTHCHVVFWFKRAEFEWLLGGEGEVLEWGYGVVG